MLKNALAVLMFAGLLCALGCSGNPTSPGTSDIEDFFAGVSPVPTGIVGNYTFNYDDGSIETGTIVRSDDGQLSMQSDREASVYVGAWFDIFVNYDPADVRYYTGMGLPVYYLGDTFGYDIDITYKRFLPLNIPFISYCGLTSEQRYYPGGGLLPGASTEVWYPFYLAPFEHVVVQDDFTIVPGTTPGNDATWVSIQYYFLGGWITFQMDSGVCGLWDP